MPRIVLERRKLIFKGWHQYRQVVAIEREYCRHFNVREAPHSKTIPRIIMNFERTGSVLDKRLSNKHTERPSTARSEARHQRPAKDFAGWSKDPCGDLQRRACR